MSPAWPVESASAPRSVTAFRIPPTLLASARAVAAERGEPLSRVVVRALERYVSSAGAK